jgi:hypothetical protein
LTCDKQTCSVKNCKRLARRGDVPYANLCRLHYAAEVKRWLRSVAMSFSEQDSCLFWPFKRDRNGYARMPSIGSTDNASRFLCEQRHGAPPTSRHQTAHTCGKGSAGCVNPLHLRWATAKENNDDKKRHGTYYVTRRKKGMSRLNPSVVREVRNLHGLGKSNVYLARRFNLSTETVERVISRAIWGWIP